jgi:DNA invertase Pin-like site-specific DNA recombinase
VAKAALKKAVKHGLRAVIYARYSSVGQTEQSIEGQLRDCYQVAEEMGFTVVKEYIDRALTGKNDKRPNFRKMIHDSACGIFDIVITWKMDRFARNRTDSALYKKTLKDNGVKVIYAAENIPDGNEGVILESVLEGLAEYYSLDLAQKTVRGKKESVRKGKHIGGKVLYGYKIDQHKYYTIDQTTAPIIQKIFNDYVSGIRASDIAKNLNAAGIKTCANGTWTRGKIGQLLRNKKYAGIYECYDIQSQEGIPSIIDLETFEEAQKLLDKNKKAGGRNKAKYRYLLSGKIKCGICDSAMCGNSSTINHTTNKKRCYYVCQGKKEHRGCNAKSVRQELVEKVVLENTMQIILQDNFIEKIADEIMKLNEMENDATNLIQTYETNIKEIESKIENIMTAIENGVTPKRMIERIKDLEEQETKLQEQINTERLKTNNTKLSKDQIVYWLSMFKDGDIHSQEFCKKLTSFFVNTVKVYPNKVAIYYNYIDHAHYESLLFFNQESLDTETLVCINLTESKILKIGKYSFCLETFFPA